MTDLQMTRTWAEISLDNLAHNYRFLRQTAPVSRFLGIVKADAYGHGALPVARALEALGADYLGVATLDEALALRAGGIAAPVLILGYTPPERCEQLLANRLTQTVFSLSDARALSAAAQALGGTLTVHVKVDTGMSRLGFSGAAQVDEIAALCALAGLAAEGIFTHFATAGDAHMSAQFDEFSALLAALNARGVSFAIRHCAASAVMLHYKSAHLDMVRPGIALYGHAFTSDLKPVMSLKSRVISLKTLPAGSAVSYGRTHILARESRVAVLPVGYADGLHRKLSNHAQVLLNDTRVPLVGQICMDFCMADVTGLPVSIGDTATVFGPALPLEEKAETLETITYELLCAVSARVPRVYQSTRSCIY